MRILFVTSEAFPLIKTGGLADVSGSLPAALNEIGADVRLLIPGYPAVLKKLVNQQTVATISGLPFIGSATLIAGVIEESGVTVLAIKSPGLYERAGGPYVDEKGLNWEDNPVRFGILSLVAAILSDGASPLENWIPDIVHCNDWQTGLTPAYMHYKKQAQPAIQQAKSVLSIHNLAFQGCYHADWTTQLGLPAASFSVNGVEYYGQLSFLKGGIYFADSIATVSPTYAQEIQTAEYGFGMQGLLAHRGHEIHGILNGIDLNEWNPAKDPHLDKRYSETRLNDKKVVKTKLQHKLGLYVDEAAPLFGVVSRLTYQKGLDMFLTIAKPFLRQGSQIALLGGGEPDLEAGFRQLAHNYPLQVSVNIGYSEPLSHQIMAGSDIFVMPSRFEPCGLNQMYGLRYGTPPIVSHTGGLADSVNDTTPESLKLATATGFVMQQNNPESLFASIQNALKYYRDDKAWRKIQRNGMRRDLGWDKSASEYLNLYQQLLT
ncbi:MAG TPA: glycogen synthase GlgA [Methylophilaceae bacterium]|nr:glycogen synthase GlgA [Methylophilaceae bacterium]